MFKHLRRPASFYRWVAVLAAPMILQNIITTSLGFMDTFMVGLLGNAEMAAVNAANTPMFVVQLVMFGFQSGMTVLVSQYWGKGDLDNINAVMGVAAIVITALTTALSLIFCFFPTRVLLLVTDNLTLVELGTSYLRIVGFSYIFNGLTTVYLGVQRCLENPQLGMKVLAVSMVLNTLMNYVLIFGKLGFAPMGITGAAVATLLSRVVEFGIVVVCALRSPTLPLRLPLLLRPGRATWRSFIRYSSPVVCNETFWGMGTSMITVILGHMANSQDMLAAHALVGYVDKFASVFCFGLAAVAAVVIGKEIGMGKSRDEVYSVSAALILVSVLVGLLSGAAMLLLLPLVMQPWLFPLFTLSEGAAYAATCMVCVLSVSTPLRAFDGTNVTGVLRGGGDVRMATVIDLAPLWLFAVPLSAVVALVLEMEVLWVCIAMYSETFIKTPIGLIRFRSKKWINDVTSC